MESPRVRISARMYPPEKLDGFLDLHEPWNKMNSKFRIKWSLVLTEHSQMKPDLKSVTTICGLKGIE